MLSLVVAAPCVGQESSDPEFLVTALFGDAPPADDDVNRDGGLSVADVTASIERFWAAPTATPTETWSVTPSVISAPTDTPGPPLTATPPPTVSDSVGTLTIQVENTASSQRKAVLSGTRVNGPPASGVEAYGPISEYFPGGTSGFDIPSGLAPGVWLHHVSVPVTGQEQYQQNIIVADPVAANVLQWTLFKTVLTVNQPGDTGDGACDTTCTLRDAVNTAKSSQPPVLISFAHSAFPQGEADILITNPAPLLLTVPGTVIDGTDSAGNPSPVADFGDRIYPTVITLIAPNDNPQPGSLCPCQQAFGGAPRIQAEQIEIEGVALHRQLAPEGTICCGDQDLVAFDADSKNSRIGTSLLDGGAAAITDANVPQGQTASPTGKDCVDAENTGSTSDEPVTIENSEIRFCHDRGLKSKAAFVALKSSWIHHNLRGGVFAQSPGRGETGEGAVAAVANLLEENGQNCPSAIAGDCGPLRTVTRTDASELSLQGALTRLVTSGNIIRNGVLQGIFFQDQSAGTIVNDYICGINRIAGGRGIEVKKAVGAESDIIVRGASVVYNDDAGVKLQDSVTADFGTDGAENAGENAFAQNGNGPSQNFVNALDPSAGIVSAEGNQWEHCYSLGDGTPDLCDISSISNNDTNNTDGEFDKVDVANPLPQESTAPVHIDAVAPAKVAEGGLVHITGGGFDAISGHQGREFGDCTTLRDTNSCDPLQGTCVEFLVDATWVEAEDILAVTPTHLVVRSPVTCTVPTLVRVRRTVLDGTEAMSNVAVFCQSVEPASGTTGTPASRKTGPVTQGGAFWSRYPLSRR